MSVESREIGARVSKMESREHLPQGDDFSFGKTVVEANGYSADKKPIFVVQNFVTDTQSAPLPEPVGDVYLGNTAAPVIDKGEIAIVPTLQPGLVDHYEQWGLLPDGKDQVVEVDLSVFEENPRIQGYPHTDILSRLYEGYEVDLHGAPVVVTFPGDVARKQISDMGGVPVQSCDTALTNNKALTRDCLGEIMADGLVVSTQSDVDDIVKRFEKMQYGVWMKASKGSGGDFVMHIPHVTRDEVYKALFQMKKTHAQAYTAGGLSRREFDSFWPKDALLPTDGAMLVVESDVRNHGKVISNMSNLIKTDESGRVSVMGTFAQMTGPEGDYKGSRPFDQEKQLRAYMKKTGLRRQEILDLFFDISVKAADFEMQLGHFGLQGNDAFLMEYPDESIGMILTEINARPPISAIGEKVSRKVHAPAWVNANIWRKKGSLNSMADIEKACTVRGVSLTHGDVKHGGVIVQAARSLYQRSYLSDQKYLCVPSNAAKVLIVGQSPEQCDDIMDSLEQNGLACKSQPLSE